MCGLLCVFEGSYYGGAGDEARCQFVLWTNYKVLAGPYPPSKSPPDSCIYIFEPVIANIKKKDHTFVWSFFFMERVTRLELATSTLARWRSTG